MSNEKVIMLIEAKIQPQRRTELIEAARHYLPQVRAESGVEVFYRTAFERGRLLLGWPNDREEFFRNYLEDILVDL